MTPIDETKLRALCVAALEQCEPDWQYIDGPLLGDVCIETRPLKSGRSKLRVDPGPLGPFIAAANPATILSLLDSLAAAHAEADRLRLSEQRAIASEQAFQSAREDLAASRAEIATMARGYRDLHDMLPGSKDVWSKVDDLKKDLSTTRQQLAEVTAEVERVARERDFQHACAMEVQRQLAAMTAARDELADIAQNGWGGSGVEHGVTARIAHLCSVGRREGSGEP